LKRSGRYIMSDPSGLAGSRARIPRLGDGHLVDRWAGRTTKILSQPSGISGRDDETASGGIFRLPACRSRSRPLVDVKPFEQLRRQKVADVLSWTDRFWLQLPLRTRIADPDQQPAVRPLGRRLRRPNRRRRHDRPHRPPRRRPHPQRPRDV